jgi:hypothetical protein
MLCFIIGWSIRKVVSPCLLSVVECFGLRWTKNERFSKDVQQLITLAAGMVSIVQCFLCFPTPVQRMLARPGRRQGGYRCLAMMPCSEYHSDTVCLCNLALQSTAKFLKIFTSRDLSTELGRTPRLQVQAAWSDPNTMPSQVFR